MFESEQLMVDEIAMLLETERERLPKLTKQSNMKVMREVNLGYGIADLVIALYGNVEESRNVFLNSTQIRILSIIENNPGIVFDIIKEKTRASTRLITKSLDVLVGENLIQIDSDRTIASNPYVTTLKNSIAIEAKLKDWRRALKQAYRYKWFSESSYVCLPSDNIKPALSNIDYFKQMKVGLISISKLNGFSIMYNPKPTKPICREMNILLNECLLNEIYSS